MNMIKAKFIFILIAAAALSMAMFSGCKLRKVKTEKTEISVKEKESSSESSTTETTSTSIGKEQVVKQNDIQEQTTTTVIEEEFPNPEPGKPSKRKTTTTTGGKIDKSKIEASKQINDSLKVIAQAELNKAKETQANAFKKAKDVDADSTVSTNAGGPWVIIVSVAIVAFLVFAYFYWGRKRKL